MRYICILLFFSLKISAQLPQGEWHAALKINATHELPFTFTSSGNNIIIHNGEEDIVVKEINIIRDSVFFRMPVFDSEFRCKIIGENLVGVFYNHARKTNNVFPFHAESGLGYRFTDRPEKSPYNISGRYHVVFAGEDEESKNAVGVFSQSGGRLTGTFLTTTGDYRYLEGEVSGNKFSLSAFDGSHLFLFTGIIKSSSLIKGEYFSGQHWHDTWIATKDESAKLPSAESLTSVIDTAVAFQFSFPDENGNIVSLSDGQFKDKAMIIQIMGSWCPNCMDETKFLSERYNSKDESNLEIIALDYERITDSITAKKNIDRLKKRFDIRYPVLFAGSSDKTEAAKTLPMLNRVFAFPTTIFLNPEKKVVKIHTGFSGPATREDFEKTKERFEELIWQITY